MLYLKPVYWKYDVPLLYLGLITYLFNYSKEFYTYLLIKYCILCLSSILWSSC